VPPPPPLPDVPALEEKGKTDGRLLTMRQAMLQHRANPTCATCHKLMDPIGFALENFDAVGGYRTLDRTRTPIEPSGVLFDGSAFESLDEFRQVLVSHQDRFVYTATKKLLTYALGRPVGPSDGAALRTIVRDAAPGGYRWTALIGGIVKSTPFRMRRATS
jgi:hypothetical protein